MRSWLMTPGTPQNTRSYTHERVFADAKQRHGMRYTHHRGQAHVSNWVRLKFTAMNLKKLARWKARRHPPLFRLLYFHSTYLFLLLRPAWRFPSLAAFRQAERTVPISHCPLAFNHKSIQVFMSPAHFSEALAFSSFAAPARFVNSGIIRSSRWYVV